MDDADLAERLDRAKAGDEAALRDLLKRFEGEVRMVVRAPTAPGDAFAVRLDGLRPGRLAERLHRRRGSTWGGSRTRGTCSPTWRGWPGTR